MNYHEFLEKLINDGIGAATSDYTNPKRVAMLEGAIEGFEACRGKSPQELLVLLKEAAERQTKAHREQAEDYWRHACYWGEIEWVCNVVSAMLLNQGLEAIIPPTYRGMKRAAEILGVDDCLGAL